MMNRWPLCLSLFFWAIGLALPPVSWSEERIQVLSPPDMAFVNGKLINLVCRIKKNSFDAIRVTIDNDTIQSLPDPVVRYNIRHSSLFLSEGENKVRIEGLLGQNTIEEKVITVYLRSALSQKYNRPPTAFAEYRFHISKNERTCMPCHEEKLRDGTALRSCSPCHKRIVDYKFVHGPAAVWACVACHNENSEKSKNGVPGPEVMVCRMCHTEELAAWHSEKFGHGPTVAGKCALCHNPHASDQPFLLVEEISNLCGFCHEEKMTNNHVMTGFSGRGHPMKQGSTQDGRSGISCASCHNPHAANNSNLLAKFNGSRMGFCRNCHN